MLKLLTKNGYQPLSERTNFNIVYDYDGNQVLSFDISTNHESFKDVHEEGTIKYRDNLHLIKKINRRKHVATIECVLDLNEWKTKMHQDFHTEYKLFSEVMLLVSPDGWIIEEAGTVTGRRAMTLEGVNNYDILMHCKKLYNITYEFHIDKKAIKVIKPDTIQSRGLFMSDELNLRDVEFKGDSSTFATRLFAYGKKIEEKDEEGKTLSTSYVNFASINDEKEYVDNLEYSKNVISAYWQDDRYIDPQSLLDDAIDKLKQLSMPNRSYSCKLLDYSRTNEKYKMLDFKLYDKATLMDSVNKVCVQHQIVQYKEYPDNENLNEVVLSSTFKSIIGTIDGIKESVSTIDTEIKRTETQINEIIRDVQSNTMRIENTYTKGEVDVKEQSIIQQTSDLIDLSISAVNTRINKIPIPQASPFPPENPIEGQVWVDITQDPPQEKIYSDGEWVTVGDYSGVLDGLTGQIESLNTSLTLEQGRIETLIKENITIINGNEVTLKEAYSYMQQEIDSIQFAISESGGNNKLLNSCGWNGLQFWESDGSVVSYSDIDVRANTISGYAFKLNEGTLKQSFKTIVGKKYSVSCKVKKNVNTCYLKIKNGTREEFLFNLNSEHVNKWTSFAFSITAEDTSCEVIVGSSSEHLIVSDIMVNDGEIAQQWSSSNDEIYTLEVHIDKTGVSVQKEGTEEKTVMNIHEFAGYDGSKKVFSVNGDTTTVNRLKAESDVQVGVVRMYAKTKGSKQGLGFAFVKGGGL